jgi:hypothetical protein
MVEEWGRGGEETIKYSRGSRASSEAAVEMVGEWRPLPTMVVVMLLTAINFAILTSASGLEVVADQGCCT